MSRAVRISRERFASLVASLTDRERQIVEVLARLRMASMPQIQRLVFVDGSPVSNARRCRSALRRLTDATVLVRLERRIGGVRAGSTGHVYCLDVLGQRLSGLEGPTSRRRRPYEAGLPFVAHILDVSELYVRLKEADRAGRLELVDFEAEPFCWRTYFGSGGALMRLKPDAFVRVARGEYEHLYFVEVDRGTESATALIPKFRAYRQYWATGREQARWDGVFPKVLWLAPTAPRLGKLIDIAQKQPPESWKLFTLRLTSEAMSLFDQEAAE